MAAPDNVEFGGASSGVVYVEGVVPAGERDISAPIKIGSRAATDPPNPVEPGDVVDAYLDLQGRQVVYHDRPLPEGDNEIGAVNVSKVAGNVTATGAGDTTSGTLRVVVAADDANIASIQMATEDMVGLIASTLIGDATGSLVKTNLRDADGNEIGTAAKPIHVDIRGEIPDAMDLDRVGGSATDVGIGNAGSGTLRVAVATDDVNIAAIKTASEASSNALDDIKAAVEGTLGTSLQTAIPAGTNEIGGVNLVKIAGTAPSTDSGNVDSGVLRVTVATDDVNIAAIKTASEASSDALNDIKAAVEGTLSTSLQTAIPAGTNEIGGVNLVKIAGTAPSMGSGNAGSGTLRVAVATDDVNIAAIKTAADAIETAVDAIETTTGTIATTTSVIESSVDATQATVGAVSDVAVDAGGEGTISAKLRRITAQLADVITALQPVAGYVEDGGDGTTTNDYADAVTIDMRSHKVLKLLIQNTDVTNSLDYKVVCYAKHGGAISVVAVEETSLAADAIGEVDIVDKWATVVLQVKSTTADTPATFAYEYIQSSI